MWKLFRDLDRECWNTHHSKTGAGNKRRSKKDSEVLELLRLAQLAEIYSNIPTRVRELYLTRLEKDLEEEEDGRKLENQRRRLTEGLSMLSNEKRRIKEEIKKFKSALEKIEEQQAKTEKVDMELEMRMVRQNVRGVLLKDECPLREERRRSSRTTVFKI